MVAPLSTLNQIIERIPEPQIPERLQKGVVNRINLAHLTETDMFWHSVQFEDSKNKKIYSLCVVYNPSTEYALYETLIKPSFNLDSSQEQIEMHDSLAHAAVHLGGWENIPADIARQLKKEESKFNLYSIFCR